MSPVGRLVSTRHRRRLAVGRRPTDHLHRPLTARLFVGIVTNMKASLLMRQRLPFSEHAFAEIVLWKLPLPMPGSSHPYKYRLAFVVDGVCVLRYDNEAGKGDHRHRGGQEMPFSFDSPEQLVNDFLSEARRIQHEDRYS